MTDDSLDTIDRKLLYELDKNCRKPLAQIAKKLRIHRNVALYRLEKFEEQGIVRGYFTAVNTHALGLQMFRTYLRTANATPQEEQAFIEEIRQDPNIVWFFRTHGKWDFDIVYVCETARQFQEWFETIKDNHNHIIDEHETAITTHIWQFPRNYLVDEDREVPEKALLPTATKEHDQTDLDILRILAQNAKKPLVEISEEAGLAVNTVKNRMKRMEKEGIIIKYQPFIDTNNIGMEYIRMHLTLKNYTIKQRKALFTHLAMHPNVVYLNKYINGADLEPELHIPSQQALQELVKTLQKEFGNIIKHIYSLPVVEEYVFRYLPGEETEKGAS